MLHLKILKKTVNNGGKKFGAKMVEFTNANNASYIVYIENSPNRVTLGVYTENSPNGVRLGVYKKQPSN